MEPSLWKSAVSFSRVVFETSLFAELASPSSHATFLQGEIFWDFPPMKKNTTPMWKKVKLEHHETWKSLTWENLLTEPMQFSPAKKNCQKKQCKKATHKKKDLALVSMSPSERLGNKEKQQQGLGFTFLLSPGVFFFAFRRAEVRFVETKIAIDCHKAFSE